MTSDNDPVTWVFFSCSLHGRDDNRCGIFHRSIKSLVDKTSIMGVGGSAKVGLDLKKVRICNYIDWVTPNLRTLNSHHNKLIFAIGCDVSKCLGTASLEGMYDCSSSTLDQWTATTFRGAVHLSILMNVVVAVCCSCILGEHGKSGQLARCHCSSLLKWGGMASCCEESGSIG